MIFYSHCNKKADRYPETTAPEPTHLNSTVLLFPGWPKEAFASIGVWLLLVFQPMALLPDSSTCLKLTFSCPSCACPLCVYFPKLFHISLPGLQMPALRAHLDNPGFLSGILIGAVGMTQWVKCLPCNTEGLSSIPRTQVELGPVEMGVI